MTEHDEDQADETNRLRCAEISADAMLEILQGKTQIVEGLPDGASVHRAGYDQERDVFYLTIDHESYDPILEAEYIPKADIVVRTVDQENSRVQGSE